jgi:hypothetical protein
MPQKSAKKSSAAKATSSGTVATESESERKETDDELRQKLRKADLRAFGKLFPGAFVELPDDLRPPKKLKARPRD